jgi:hypothetical protein
MADDDEQQSTTIAPSASRTTSLPEQRDLTRQAAHLAAKRHSTIT